MGARSICAFLYGDPEFLPFGDVFDFHEIHFAVSRIATVLAREVFGKIVKQKDPDRTQRRAIFIAHSAYSRFFFPAAKAARVKFC